MGNFRQNAFSSSTTGHISQNLPVLWLWKESIYDWVIPRESVTTLTTFSLNSFYWDQNLGSWTHSIDFGFVISWVCQRCLLSPCVPESLSWLRKPWITAFLQARNEIVIDCVKQSLQISLRTDSSGRNEMRAILQSWLVASKFWVIHSAIHEMDLKASFSWKLDTARHGQSKKDE